MDNKSFRLELKTLSDQGTFTGMASVFGVEDLGGDVVEHGAFARTLAHKGSEIPLLFAHDTREPIGIGKLKETAKGLEITGELVLEVARAREAYALMKKGVLKGLSIGYDVVSDAVVGGVRHLKELKLYEVSVCTFPMNELATVTSVKSDDVFADQVRMFRETLRAAEKSLNR